MLPRVTYSNVRADFSGVHDRMDAVLADFSARGLGLDWTNRIGGEARKGAAVTRAPSPIDIDLLLGVFHAADAALVDDAVRAARKAYGPWSHMDWRDRIAIMRRFADVVEETKYDLAAACLIEVGKSRMEALGEVEEAIDLIRYYAGQMEKNDGFVIALDRAFPNEETSDRLRPLGVFGVIAPFNFPVALSIAMMSAALIAGNTVVFKPSEWSGLTGGMIVAAMEKAGLPAGAVNLLFGGPEVGRAMSDHPGFDGFAFTGSHKVGTELIRKVAAGRYVRPVLVEMGGKNPTYVTGTADLDVAAEGVMRSAFGLQGQKCSAGSKVYVQEDVMQGFMERLLAATDKARIGDPRERTTFVGPVVNDAALARYMQACAEAQRDGQLPRGGARLTEGAFARGRYVTPAIATHLPASHRLHKDELFLPFLTVQPFRSLDAALDDGNSVDYGLTAGCYARDEAEIELFLDRAEAGALYVNRASGATTGAWPGIQTFCGWKGSGASGKGGLGPHYLPQFMREQSRTIWR